MVASPLISLPLSATVSGALKGLPAFLRHSKAVHTLVCEVSSGSFHCRAICFASSYRSPKRFGQSMSL